MFVVFYFNFPTLLFYDLNFSSFIISKSILFLGNFLLMISPQYVKSLSNYFCHHNRNKIFILIDLISYFLTRW